jgi:pyruvate formate lyase activating enzyme
MGIAFTYNEPTVWFEYMLEIAIKIKEKELKNIMVTNGFINEEPLRKLTDCIDAFSVDLKSWTDYFYRKYTSSTIEPVKKALKLIHSKACFLEITNLVIPGLNDNEKDFSNMMKWITSELGPYTVLHISRYHPSYKLEIPGTSYETLENLYNIAKEYLHYVYLGNVITSKGNNTYCPQCNNLLINREGYKTSITGMTNKGKCAKCSFQALPSENILNEN